VAQLRAAAQHCNGADQNGRLGRKARETKRDGACDGGRADLLHARDVSVVLTGDIGAPVERTLPARMLPSRLRIVKVPHHGSLTSSTTEFIRALAPTVAVVSAGRANRFGHPVPEVLARYREARAEVFRTDQDGAVTVTTDGYSLQVDTFGAHTEPPRRHEDTKEK